MNFHEEQNKIQELRKRQSGLNTGRSGCLYHYRTLEGFWNIIESDSFWATNARFSNDQEEQMLGVKLISEKLNLNEDEGKTLLKDCYIVCFCEEDDCLSQWRGYAKDGISIGFDFADTQCFCVEKGDKSILCYNRCCKVAYFSEGQEKEWFEKVFLIPPNVSKNRLPTIVPFIKHKGFYEEKEYRLVFEDKGLYELVQYRNQNGKKIPYIVVKSGAKERDDSQRVYVRLVMSATRQREVRDIIEKQLKRGKIVVGPKAKMNIEIVECGNVAVQEKQCIGCMQKRFYHAQNYNDKWKSCKKDGDVFYIEEDAVYISQCKNQDKIFDIIYNALHEKLKDDVPKVWCEGHLPIRTITVGPRADKEQVKESIEHYCKHTYWLKDVEVKASTIPYRS